MSGPDVREDDPAGGAASGASVSGGSASGGSGNPSTRAARVVVQALAALGVAHVVLAPGSRSAPLAYALAETARGAEERDPAAPHMDLHVRVDERSAGFLAVGLSRGARAAGREGVVAVVTTSGTAVANLHPAVLEAHHSGLPLLLVTADRPHELRGAGANQTTEQVGLLQPVRLMLDVPAPTGRPGEDRDLRHLVSRAVAAAVGARTGDPGPVHLNLAFREPLAPDAAPWPADGRAGRVDVVRRGTSGDERSLQGAAQEVVGGREDGLDVVGATMPAGARATMPAAPATGTMPAAAGGARATMPAAAAGARATVPAAAGATVVVAGDGAGPEARHLAETQGWPLLAEPSSGARGGPNAIPAYRLLLADERLGGAVRRVFVLGRPTLSRPVQALLGRADVETVVVAPWGAAWPDAMRNAEQVVTEVPRVLLGGSSPATSEWLRTWQRAGAAALRAVREVADHGAAPTELGSVAPAEAARGSDVLKAGGQAATGPDSSPDLSAGPDSPSDLSAGPRSTHVPTPAVMTGPALAQVVAAACGADDVLVVGASNPVRDLDLVAAWDEPPMVLSNRGLAGIDGTLSTASGVALALGRPVVAYLGDLTFLHDVGGLLTGPLERRPDLHVVVANDDGGSIFATLEHGDEAHATAFERVFGTPHGVDLGSLCRAYGVAYTVVSGAEQVRAALIRPAGGVSVTEVRVDRLARRELGERCGDAVRAAVDRELGPVPSR